MPRNRAASNSPWTRHFVRLASASCGSVAFIFAVVASLTCAFAAATPIPAVSEISRSAPGYMPAETVRDMPVADFDRDGRADLAVLAQVEYSDLIEIMGYDDSGDWKTKQIIAPDAGVYEFSPDQLSTWVQGGEVHLLFSRNEHFFEYSGWPLHLDRRFDLEGLIDVSDSRVADIDNDGVFEIVVASNFPSPGIRAYSVTTGAPLWEVLQPGVHDGTLMIAQLDEDPALEVARGGSAGIVVDGVTHAIEWEYKDGFGASVMNGRFGGDTPRFAGLGTRLVMFQSMPWSPLWEISNLNSSASVVHDIDGDGVEEIIYSEFGSQSGMRVLDVQTRSLRLSFDAPSISRLAVADLDGDAQPDMALGAYPNIYESSSKAIYLFDATKGTLEDSFAANAAGPYLAGGFVGGTRETDLIVGSASGSRFAGALARINSKTGAVRWRTTYDDPLLGLTRVFDLNVASVSGRSNPVVLASGRGDLPGRDRIVAVATEDGRALWSISSETNPAIPGYAVFEAIDAIDSDGDSRAESILACTSEPRLRQFLLSDRTQSWASGILNGTCRGFLDAPFGGPEQLVSVMSTGLLAFDAQTHDLVWSLPFSGGLIGASFIPAGETGPELALFTPNRIDFFDASTRSFRRRLDLPADSSLQAIRQSAASSIHALLVALDGRLQVMDGINGQVKERSDFLGRNLGRGNHLALTGQGSSSMTTGLGSDVAVFFHSPSMPSDLIFYSDFGAPLP